MVACYPGLLHRIYMYCMVCVYNIYETTFLDLIYPFLSPFLI